MVNYKGLPFMQGLTDNRFLMWSLSLCGMGAFIAASNMLPFFNTWLQLTEYPSDTYQNTFLRILSFNMVATFVWDRLMLAIFAPHVFAASVKSMTFGAAMKIVRILGIIAFLFYFFRDISLDEFETIE